MLFSLFLNHVMIPEIGLLVLLLVHGSRDENDQTC